jgi:hypothetical protein
MFISVPDPIRPKVSDPYGSGSGSATLLLKKKNQFLMHRISFEQINADLPVPVTKCSCQKQAAENSVSDLQNLIF